MSAPGPLDPDRTEFATVVCSLCKRTVNRHGTINSGNGRRRCKGYLKKSCEQVVADRTANTGYYAQLAACARDTVSDSRTYKGAMDQKRAHREPSTNA